MSIIKVRARPKKEKLGPLKPWQFHKLIKKQKLRKNIDQFISTIPDEDDRAMAEAQLDYATEFHRLDPVFVSVTTGLGMTDDEIDELWEAAVAS